MKKNRIIQFSLIIVAILLFFFTYYSNKNREEIVDIDVNKLIKDKGNVTNKTSNIIESANYNGTDNRGTFFELNAKLAEVFHDTPNISNMKVVDAIVNLKDGRKIYIQSDICVYNRLTNDAEFTGNVLVTESNNKITSDNLDLIITKNLITIYNNVKYDGEKGFLIADKVNIDILKNEFNVFMFNKKNKVKVKYNN